MRRPLTSAGASGSDFSPRDPGAFPFAERGRLCAARALSAMHLAIVLLFVVGWALPWRGVLAAVVVAAPVVQAGWWLFGDRCLLTLLERRLRGASPPRAASADEAPPNFLVDLASTVVGRPVSDAWVNVTARVVMWTAFTIAALRLALGG